LALLLYKLTKMTDVYIPKTELEKFVIDNIDSINISWASLSINPNITWEFRHTFQTSAVHCWWHWDSIFQELDITLPIFKKYNLHRKPNVDIFLSKNRSFDLRIVDEYPDLRWNWDELSKHYSFDIDFLITHIDKKIDWYYLTDNRSCRKYNPIMFDEALLEHPDLPWKWAILSINTDISFETIRQLKDKEWNWMYLSSSQENTDIIDKYPELPWDWYLIDVSILDTEFIRKYHMKDWDWSVLINNQLITHDFILEFPDIDYDWHAFGPNELWDIQTIKMFKDKNLNWTDLSMSCGISEKDIKDNIDLPWDWDSLSLNNNITHKFIQKYKDKPWNFALICLNRFRHGSYPCSTAVEYSEINMFYACEKLQIYKEELIQKTWHPSRLMDWCLSIDELE
jgi:hypothetical protein